MLLGEEELTIYEYLAFLSAYPEIYPEANSEPQQNEVSFFCRISSKLINIRWIRTGPQPYGKIMSSIVLRIYEYKNVQS